MRAQIRGLDQAARNSNDGISLIATAEGAMIAIADMVNRIRELVVQAANDTNDYQQDEWLQSDRARIQEEINNLLEEIDLVSGRAEFNKKKLIDGSWDGTGVTLDSQNLIDLLDLRTAQRALAESVVDFKQDEIFDPLSTLGVLIDNAMNAGPPGMTSTEAARIRDALAVIVDQYEKDASNVSVSDSSVAENKLENAISQLTFDFVTRNMDIFSNPSHPALGEFEAIRDHLIDDTAGFRNDLTTALQSDFDDIKNSPGWDVLPAAKGNSLYFQIGANAFQGVSFNIAKMDVEALTMEYGQTTDKVSTNNLTFRDLRNGNATSNPPVAMANGLGVVRASGEELSGFLEVIDNALVKVSAERAKLGAIQNRLEYAVQNVENNSINLAAAQSRVRDTDMGKEAAAFTKANVLQQAATSMLAQANQLPNMILQLLPN